MTAFVSVDWLNAHQTDPDTVILYTRLANILTGEVEPLSNNVIPGARLFDFEQEFSDKKSDLPHTLPSSETFTQRAQEIGINQNSQIVIYDTQGLYSAPRAWWMLKAMGHNKVFILDGGLPEWVRHGYDTCSELTTGLPLGDFVASLKPGFFVAKEAIVENLASRKRLVLDARSHERFLGIAKEPRDGLRSGHIPHSVSLPFTSLIADGKLKSLECIKDCFKAYESEFKGVITSCGSGVTACILALAATEIGLKQVSVYDGSWTEWGSDSENPIETTSL